MFRKWLEQNRIEDFDFSVPLFEKGSNRKFWEEKYNKDYVTQAEKYLGYNWPHIKASDYMAFANFGDRMAQEDKHYARRNPLCSLVIGEIFEYKKRFIPDIVDGIFLTCEESYWGLSAHSAPYIQRYNTLPDAKNPYIDLYAGETAALLAITYYILYDEIYEYCPDILVRIEQEIERRIIMPYINHMEFWWMGNCTENRINNWNPWILSNILTAFLIFEKRPNIMREGIIKMLYEINNIYEMYPDDGSCEEGSTYWSHSGGCIFEFCNLIYTATNGMINFFNDEKIKNIGKYEYKVYIGDGYFVNFADGAPRCSQSMNSILYMYGLRTDEKRLQSFAKEIYNFNKKAGNVSTRNKSYRIVRILNDLIVKDEIEKLPDFVPQESCLLEGIKAGFVRADKWYYAIKGGANNESHNHNDIGSFIVYYDNKPVLVDPSCGTYTKKTFSEQRYEIWTMQSGWHNLPVINGIEQEFGEEYVSDDISLENAVTDLDFPLAYPEEAGIKSLHRQLSLNENGILLEDSFGFENEKNHISEHFITPYSVEIKDGKAIIDNHFVLESDTANNISIESVDFEGDTKLINMWSADKMNRIKFDFEAQKSIVIKIKLKKI